MQSGQGTIQEQRASQAERVPMTAAAGTLRVVGGPAGAHPQRQHALQHRVPHVLDGLRHRAPPEGLDKQQQVGAGVVGRQRGPRRRALQKQVDRWGVGAAADEDLQSNARYGKKNWTSAIRSRRGCCACARSS